MGRRIAAVAITLLLCFASGSLPAQSDAPAAGDLVLRHEFWCERQPHPAAPVALTLSEAEAMASIEAEASFVYAGMIRGFSVRWTPPDLQRRVAETFSLEPAAGEPQAPQGDRGVFAASPSPQAAPFGSKASPNAETARIAAASQSLLAPGRLSLSEARMDGTRLLAYAEYRADGREAALYDSWRKSSYPVAGGLGKAREIGGPANRIEAMKDAIRAALNSYARDSIPTRPRQVIAVAAFEEPPTVKLEAGQYVASVRVRLRILEVRAYGAY